ncbi:MAG TPA: beta-L-arabinofuranosidase domain-containing protein, partial [Chitinophagaceae bacterium]
RMLLLTGHAKYADVMELALYNSVLSGISLNGKNFLYTNPLAFSDQLPFQQRWSKDRVPYISLSNCCPPNVVRTIAEVSNYAYSISDKGLWINLYGSNALNTKLKDGTGVQLLQQTDYPWDGRVTIKIENDPKKRFSVFLRIPGWSKNATLKVNGEAQKLPSPGEYAEINKTWQKGDVIELIMPMPAVMMEANPLVEETRNQVAVKRGPIVYCLESADVPAGYKVFDIGLKPGTEFKTVKLNISGSNIVTLECNGQFAGNGKWNDQLYKEIVADNQKIPVRLVPYYSWGNRGHAEMAVWLPRR